MKKNIARVAIVATAAASVLVGFATSASATAGSVTTQDNGSAGPVHLWLERQRDHSWFNQRRSGAA